MKNLKITVAICVMALFSSFGFSQEKKPKCDASAFADEHNSNQRWNDLIDNACQSINKGKYKDAYVMLSDAMTMDSLSSSNGVINEYIAVQVRNLKKYLDNSKGDLSENENGTVKKTGEPPAETKKTNNKKKEEPVKQPENNNSNIETSSTPPPAVSPEPVKPDPIPEPVHEKPETKNDTVAADDGSARNANVNDDIKKTDDNSVKSFSELEKAEFHDKGFAKLNLLQSYLQDISSKSTPADLAEKDIENAIQLFDSEDRTVQVSSVNTPVKNTYKIRKYLEKLQILNYDNINIEWAEFEYTSDFIKGYDGNYHGYITFKQRFTATKDYIPVYEDITTKKIEVIIKPYEKGIEGEKYDVFLGDMSVIQTDKK